MKKVLFENIAIGKMFALYGSMPDPDFFTKIQPRSRTKVDKPCDSCGEPAATWVNAEGGALRLHVCPKEAVYIDA